MLIGLCGAIAAWVRGHASAGFAALFAFGALHQAVAWQAARGGPLPFDAAPLGAAALAGLGAAALVALRALLRTTRERDRAEELHWESMELIRGMHALAAQPCARPEEKLARLLELGAAHFRLAHAIVCRIGDGAPEVFAWRGPEGAGDELAAALAPRLLEAAAATVARERGDPGCPARLPAFLGAPVRGLAGPACVLAFAGKRDARLTATDKDLIGAMADWLHGELAPRELAAPAERAAPAVRRAKRIPAQAPLRERRDLNRAVRRVEARLRERAGSESKLALSLAESLPVLSPQRIPLEALVESLVVAAQGLVRGGALEVETASLEAPDAAPTGAAHATLSVRARGDAIGADAAALAFGAADASGAADAGPLPLAQVERLLRRAGGDLSVQLEPGRGALLTAFLPGSAQAL